MSDQDTPPPMDDDTSGQDAPPPLESEKAESPKVNSIPTEAPPTAGVGLGQGKLGESDEKTMSLLAHLLGAFTSFAGALIIWLIKKDESPFVDDQGKEALNFQITVAIGFAVATVLGAVTGGCLSLVLYPVVWIFSLIFSILGGVEANKGIAYRYPFAVRLIS